MNVHDNAALLWSILNEGGGTIRFGAWRELSGLAPAAFLAAFNLLGRQQMIEPGDVGDSLEDGTWVAVRDEDEGGH